MPQIRRPRLGDSIEASAGTPLMTALLDAGIPVASSCGGDGVCTKCVLRILEGSENLSPIGELETELLERTGKTEGHRISCQARVQGDVSVDASYW